MPWATSCLKGGTRKTSARSVPLLAWKLACGRLVPFWGLRQLQLRPRFAVLTRADFFAVMADDDNVPLTELVTGG